MTRPECQHLTRADGGTWCGDPDTDFGSIGLALRPRVPVCAVRHIKAMHYRAERQAWAEARVAATLTAAQVGTPTNPHAWAEGYAEAVAHILGALEVVSWSEFLTSLARKADDTARRAQDTEGGATP